MTNDIELLFACKKNTPGMLFDFIKTIKNREMRTNSQWTIQFLQEKYNQNQIWIRIETDIAIVLFRDTENILRLTYFSRDEKTLSLLNSIIPVVDSPVVCDLLGKEPTVTERAAELTHIGLKPYAQYKRMICTELQNFDESLDLTAVETAKEEDIEEIFTMLHDEFDVITARMPGKEIIRQRIKDKDVFVIRQNKTIGGFIVFDSCSKKNALLEYVMVRPELRNMHIAKKIWNYKLRFANASKYYFLWVNMARKTAIKFHQSNGYHFDGLVDNIFLVPKSLKEESRNG